MENENKKGERYPKTSIAEINEQFIAAERGVINKDKEFKESLFFFCRFILFSPYINTFYCEMDKLSQN